MGGSLAKSRWSVGPAVESDGRRSRDWLPRRAAVVAGDRKGYSPVADSVRAVGGRALGVELDVTNSVSARAAVEAAIAQFGGLHILVNNTGIDQRGRLEELSEADWDRVLAVNLKGPFLCSQAAAPRLETGGAIVNVASLAGRSSSPLQGCHYWPRRSACSA